MIAKKVETIDYKYIKLPSLVLINIFCLSIFIILNYILSLLLYNNLYYIFTYLLVNLLTTKLIFRFFKSSIYSRFVIADNNLQYRITKYMYILLFVIIIVLIFTNFAKELFSFKILSLEENIILVIAIIMYIALYFTSLSKSILKNNKINYKLKVDGLYHKQFLVEYYAVTFFNIEQLNELIIDLENNSNLEYFELSNELRVFYTDVLAGDRKRKLRTPSPFGLTISVYEFEEIKDITNVILSVTDYSIKNRQNYQKRVNNIGGIGKWEIQQ